MHQVLKIFFLAACLLVAAFFANFFGYVSIPWLDLKSVPTYGGAVKATDEAVKQAIESGKTDKAE